jgi:ParG
MTKQTALASATKKPVDPEAWVSEKPTSAAASEKPARLVVELPADLHRQLKGKCGREGLKIKDVIQNLLEQYLAGSKKKS